MIPPPAAEPKPSPAADTPAAEGELQEGGGKEEGEKGVSKEVKCEDKGNLAGERQSGDGQVKWIIEKKKQLKNRIRI